MRYIFSLFLILLSVYLASASSIDSLKSKNDVRFLLKKHNIEAGEAVGVLFKEDYKEYGWPYPLYTGTDSFYIADVDKNGYSDIIIDVSVFSVVLDIGKDSFKLEMLSGSSDARRYSYMGMLLTDTQNYLIVGTSERKYTRTGEIDIISEDTLIYKDGFIDYIPNAKKETIRRQVSFDYFPGFCFDCSKFTLKINSDRPASYSLTKMNNEKKRIDTISATTVVSKDIYQKLVDVLNDADFSKLEDSYSVDATDHPDGNLIIVYGENRIKRIKRISDYGLRGTLALRKVYEELFTIQASNIWTIKVSRGISYKKLHKQTDKKLKQYNAHQAK